MKSPEPETSQGSPGELDLEVKDPNLIFESVWAQLELEFGAGGLRFPREIIWLNGAPGAGKGTQTAFIQKTRDLTAETVVVSSLLKSPEAQRLIDAGMMVGDKEVTLLVFRKLLDPEQATGAVVDGYPRTDVQVRCLKLLFDKLTELSKRHAGPALENPFPKPVFHIIVLFVDEAESVKRQLHRGRAMEEANREVTSSGIGAATALRKTDLSEESARNRYRTFKEVTYESLITLREVFHFHYINAHGTVEEVQERIDNELRYQSSLELNPHTFQRISNIPIASKIVVHARQELVNRLDGYETYATDLFDEVVQLVEQKFMPIILRHSISGLATINSEEAIFDDPEALAMLIDIFSERGYHAVVDVRRYEIPESVDLQTGAITCVTRRVYRFRISFEGTEIRRRR
jgi:adenylate kinase